MFSPFTMNQYSRPLDQGLTKWFLNNHLDGFSKMMNSVQPEDEKKQAIINRIRGSAFPAVEKLQHFTTHISASLRRRRTWHSFK